MHQAPPSGAMLLLFDIAAEAVDEHDHWHTHEHLPERLAIPGFRRGTRWTRSPPSTPGSAGPGYCVLYEVDSLAVLDGADYRARLENPTPWTAKMMTHYVGMRRTLCEVVGEAGVGVGGACLVVTFAPREGQGAALRQRLLEGVLAGLHLRRGLVGWRLLENALPAPMTREQAIRGRDTAVHSALCVMGYDARAVAALAAGELGAEGLGAAGAEHVEPAVFTLAHTLAAAGGAQGARAGS